MKLRAGYGVTGTQPNSSFLGVGTLGYMVPSTPMANGFKRLYHTKSQPYLRWERKRNEYWSRFAFLEAVIGKH